MLAVFSSFGLPLKYCLKLVVRVAKARRLVSEPARTKGRLNTHCIKIVESLELRHLGQMGPQVAALLSWTYIDGRLEPGLRELEERRSVGRLREVVISCTRSGSLAASADGLTVVVDDVCDLNQPDSSPSLHSIQCLQRIMLALKPPEASRLAKKSRRRGRHDA